MWSAATTRFERSHLPHFSPVDSVCTMGMLLPLRYRSPLLSRIPTQGEFARGLFCAQLLARMLHTLTESTVP